MKNRIKYINLQHQEAKLTDTPINQHDDETLTPRFQDHQGGSSSPSSLDFFEFFYDPEETYNMSHAEDIIFCGKLLPKDYKFQRPNDLFDKQILKSVSRDEGNHTNITNLQAETNTSGSDSVDSSKTAVTRSRRSLDSNGKPRRNSKAKVVVSDVHHRTSTKISSSVNNKSREGYVDKNNSKPSWHFIVFGGLVKASPPEIDIRDMKNRQSRLSSSTFLPEKVAGDGNAPASKRRSRRGKDLLEVLSCKSHSSVGFTEPASIVRRPISAVR